MHRNVFSSSRWVTCVISVIRPPFSSETCLCANLVLAYGSSKDVKVKSMIQERARARGGKAARRLLVEMTITIIVSNHFSRF